MRGRGPSLERVPSLDWSVGHGLYAHKGGAVQSEDGRGQLFLGTHGFLSLRSGADGLRCLCTVGVAATGNF